MTQTNEKSGVRWPRVWLWVWVLLGVGATGAGLWWLRTTSVAASRQAFRDAEEQLAQALSASLQTTEDLRRERSRQRAALAVRISAQARATAEQVCARLTAVRPNPAPAAGWENVLGMLVGRMPPAGASAVEPEKLLLDCGPDLAALTAKNQTLRILEKSRGILELAAAANPDKAEVAAETVELPLELDAADGKRRWTVQVTAYSNPTEVARDPSPQELIRTIAGQEIFNPQNERRWQGWLSGTEGKLLARFPPEPTDFPEAIQPGVWERSQIAGRPYATLSGAAKAEGLGQLNLQLLQPDPPLAQRLGETAAENWPWAALGGLLWLAAAGGLFVLNRRPQSAVSRATPPARPVEAKAPAQNASPAPKPQLIRTDAPRAIPEDASLLRAEISAGLVNLQPEAPAEYRVPRRPLPTGGSLTRLQALHRGGERQVGSQILDHARSPLLRQMAAKIRPRDRAADAPPTPAARPGVARPAAARERS